MTEPSTPAGQSPPPAGPPACSGPPARGSPPARRRRSVRRLALGLAGIALAAAAVVLTPRQGGDPVRGIDWAPIYREGRQVAQYPVLAPVDLRPDWRPISARTTDTAGQGSLAWRLDYRTPSGGHAAVAQSDGDTDRFVADLTRDGEYRGVLDVERHRWRRVVRRSAGSDYRALVRAAEGSVVLVVGTAPWTELAELAAALRR